MSSRRPRCFKLLLFGLERDHSRENTERTCENSQSQFLIQTKTKFIEKREGEERGAGGGSGGGSIPRGH